MTAVRALFYHALHSHYSCFISRRRQPVFVVFTSVLVFFPFPSSISIKKLSELIAALDSWYLTWRAHGAARFSTHRFFFIFCSSISSANSRDANAANEVLVLVVVVVVVCRFFFLLCVRAMKLSCIVLLCWRWETPSLLLLFSQFATSPAVHRQFVLVDNKAFSADKWERKWDY